jgi:predicted MFS family arabinose efflux permease
MTPQHKSKTPYFILEGLNSAATVFYTYYVYFLMKSAYGWSDAANLRLAAMSGCIYMFGAWWGGKFAQRFGYSTALKIGYCVMALALAAGCLASTAGGHVAVLAAVLIGMCFTWPALEALISENEAPASLQHQLGVYNVIWAGTGALAYFFGGTVLDRLGFKSLYFLPAVTMVAQLIFTWWIGRKSASIEPAAMAGPAPSGHSPVQDSFPALNPRPISRARRFLKMAWLANPFAYVALQTVIAVIPGVARRLDLSTSVAGFCCSVWCFSRMGGFVALWLWSGWHYRFAWLLAAYLTLVGAFVGILTASNLPILLLAQVLFGASLALIYYSSLFYAMDVGEAKGEHGGIHEAAIGLGNFAGPAVGALSLHLWPANPRSDVLAVSVLLIAGLAALLSFWRAGR